MGWDGDAMGQGDVTVDPASSAATTDRPRALRPRPETGPLAAMLRSHQAFAANLPGGTRISLKFCDLAGIDLSGRKLARADFTGASLRGADFSGADLTDALLFGADLHEARLDDACLARADLR